MPTKRNFWEYKTLSEMSHSEWESLCDNCARCCLHKFADEETGQVRYTDVACGLLDLTSCRCTDYKERHHKVPSCLKLSADRPESFHWLPDTCAYRRIAEGKPLFDWHPLVSGDPDAVHQCHVSVRQRCVPEHYIHPDEIELRQTDRISCSLPGKKF